jgi:hypothetical protein
MPGKPLIVYIPGLKPKPEPGAHRRELFRCLLEGVRRLDPETATALGETEAAFEIVSWTYDFYGEHRDISLDQQDLDSLLKISTASESDRAIATSWKRRLLRWMFRTADFLPFAIPSIATEELELHLRDLHRYTQNRNGSADAARDKLKTVLNNAAAAERPVLLLAHSMGSVIAYDALWQLSQETGRDTRVHLLVTMGSPLGQKLIQRRLLSSKEQRYPQNIANWINLAAVGELTAIDMTLKSDFGEMVDLGLVADIDDRAIYNYYHMHGTLNVHAEYGYLINEVTASIVSDWWCARRSPGRGSA